MRKTISILICCFVLTSIFNMFYARNASASQFKEQWQEASIAEKIINATEKKFRAEIRDRPEWR